MNSPFRECVNCGEDILEHLSKCPKCGKVNPFVRKDRNIEKELKMVES